MTPPARTPQQRTQDVLAQLDQEVDAWVATADAATGTPYLIPLSFLWESETLLISTPDASPTSRNLHSTGQVRLGLGGTRDVVLIEGRVEPLEMDDLSGELGDRFATKTGFDPRELSTPYRFFRIHPQRIQAWREANELDGRTLMRDGRWLMAG